jgi:hypothetical protein
LQQCCAIRQRIDKTYCANLRLSQPSASLLAQPQRAAVGVDQMHAQVDKVQATALLPLPMPPVKAKNPGVLWSRCEYVSLIQGHGVGRIQRQANNPPPT